MAPGDDGELVGRCLKGDERAYRELIARYQAQVYNLSMHISAC